MISATATFAVFKHEPSIGFVRVLTVLTVRGDGTRIVAERLGISQGRVSQLRRKYEAAWRAFQGETLDERSAA